MVCRLSQPILRRRVSGLAAAALSDELLLLWREHARRLTGCYAARDGVANDARRPVAVEG